MNEQINRILETTECIPIHNQQKRYFDCMEFSLLRFLHILCSHEQEENGNEFFYQVPSELEDDLDIELSIYMDKYPIIFLSADYYAENIEGRNERVKWANFVSNRSCFEYFRNDYAELFPNLYNIFQFYQNFFQLPLLSLATRNLNDPETKALIQENFQVLSTAFSTPQKKFQFEILSYSSDINRSSFPEILHTLSREDEEYSQSELINSTYPIPFIESETIIGIFINEKLCYKWYLTEVYFDQEKYSFKNPLLDGHSIIHLA